MKFNHLNVPSHWEHYWTRYPEGYTILEALISWVSQVDDMTDNVNDWNTYLEGFVESFDTDLQTTVKNTINELKENGVLQEIINHTIFSDINTKIDDLETDTTIELGKRPTRDEMNTKMTQLQSGVKGIYSTITELKTAHPTGDTGNYVLESDGHIYTWKNNSWTNTGILYQATAIADNSVTDNKLVSTYAFGKSGKNLFNKTDIVVGAYPNQATGELTPYAEATTSGFIELDTVESHVILSGSSAGYAGGGSFYDADKNFISSHSSSDFKKGVAIPEGAVYLRVATRGTELETTQLEYGNVSTPYEPYKNVVINEGVTFQSLTQDVRKRLEKPTYYNYLERNSDNTLKIVGSRLSSHTFDKAPDNTPFLGDNQLTLTVEGTEGANSYTTTELASDKQLLDKIRENGDFTVGYWVNKKDLEEGLTTSQGKNLSIYFQFIGAGTSLGYLHFSPLVDYVYAREEHFTFSGGIEGVSGSFIFDQEHGDWVHITSSIVMTNPAVTSIRLLQNVSGFVKGSQVRFSDPQLILGVLNPNLKYPVFSEHEEVEVTKQLANKNVLLIGDSITWLDGTTDPNRNNGETVIGWQQSLRDLGATIINKAQSGHTYRKYVEGVSNLQHGSLYDDIVEGVYNPSDIDKVLMVAGTNDVGRGLQLGTVGGTDPNNTLDAMSMIIEYLFSKNKELEFYIVTPPFRQNSQSNMELLVPKLKDVARYYNLPFYDNYHEGNINNLNITTYLYDSVHPNNKGMALIGSKIAKFVTSK